MDIEVTGISQATSIETPNVVRRPKRIISVHGVVRWLHLYVSMVGFLAMLFFAITGVTLNHPTWFGESTSTSTHRGKLQRAWLGNAGDSIAESSSESLTDETVDDAGREVNPAMPANDDNVDKLSVVEYLRATHGLRGMVKEFLVDEEECSIAMNGPGYSADTLIDRVGATYEVTVVEHGTIAVWNDLHKGRDTGAAWSWAIDLSAVIMAISCVTGLVMLLFMKRKRVSGTIWTAIGATVFIAVAVFLVK